MIVQTETKQTQDGDITPEDTAEELTPTQMRERDAAYATIKTISDNTGKPIAAVIADLRKLMMRDAKAIQTLPAIHSEKLRLPDA